MSVICCKITQAVVVLLWIALFVAAQFGEVAFRMMIVQHAPEIILGSVVVGAIVFLLLPAYKL